MLVRWCFLHSFQVSNCSTYSGNAMKKKKTPQLPLTNGHHTKVRFTWRMAGIAASCSWKLKSKVYSGLAGALRMKSRCLGPRVPKTWGFLICGFHEDFKYFTDISEILKGSRMWGYPKIAILVRKMIRNKALNCLGECPMFFFITKPCTEGGDLSMEATKNEAY